MGDGWLAGLDPEIDHLGVRARQDLLGEE